MTGFRLRLYIQMMLEGQIIRNSELNSMYVIVLREKKKSRYGRRKEEKKEDDQVGIVGAPFILHSSKNGFIASPPVTQISMNQKAKNCMWTCDLSYTIFYDSYGGRSYLPTYLPNLLTKLGTRLLQYHSFLSSILSNGRTTPMLLIYSIVLPGKQPFSVLLNAQLSLQPTVLREGKKTLSNLIELPPPLSNSFSLLQQLGIILHF